LAKSIKKAVIDNKPILHVNLRIFFLIGLYFIIFTSPFLRGLFFQQDLLPVLILVAISFAFCVYDQVLRREVELFKHPLDWAMLALVIAYALSLITAVHMRQAIGELLKITAYFMVYWMACRAAKTEKDFNFFLFISYLAGIGVALIGLGAAAGVINIPAAYEGRRIMSTFQYPNTLAIYLAALNIIGLALSVRTERLIPRLFYAAGNLIILVVIVGTESRGGWVLYPLVMAGFIALINNNYRWRALYHLIIFLGCGIVTAQVFFNSLKTVQGITALKPVIIGLLAVIIIQLFYYFLGLWLNRDTVEDRTRKLVAYGGFSYLALVIMVYLWYAASAFPVPVAQVVPVDAISRAQHISAQENSFTQRMEYNKDALKIIKDYPITGTGGGGWNALYHSYAPDLYWSTETHNYFFQTWVESGTIGFLVLISIWVFFIITLHRFRQRDEDDDDYREITIWAAGMAAIALGLHSAFDFDMSMPAVGILLYGFIGAVKGRIENEIPQDITSKAKTDQTVKHKYSNGKLIATSLLATLAALALAYPAYSFYTAGVYGAQGAKAILAKDLNTAKIAYEQAVKKDPFTASYTADLAQVWAVQAIAEDDAIAHFTALDYAEKAAAAEPYNTKVRATLINVYSLLREDELMVAEAKALVNTNPLVIDHHEILAKTLMDAAQHYLEREKRDKAVTCLKEIIDIENNLPACIKKSSPALKTAAEQAEQLLKENQ